MKRIALIVAPIVTLLGVGAAVAAPGGESPAVEVTASAAPVALTPEPAVEPVSGPASASAEAATEALVEAPPPVVESPPVEPEPEPPAAPVEPAPARFSRCEIRSFALGGSETWGVAGWTEEPRGTVFTFTLTVDGETQVLPLVAKAGSMIFSDGSRYGTPGQYEDSGSTNFGFTSEDMPALALPHGPVSASVTLGDKLICSA